MRHDRLQVFPTIVMLCALCLLPYESRAQVTTGSIVGTVRDGTGGVLPGITVIVTNESTGETRTVVTNDRGDYSVASLLPGAYTVTGRLEGFKTTSIRNLVLQIDQVLRADIALTMGEITEEVNVIGGAVLVQSESASMGQVFDAQRVVDLPLNGRNFVQLATLSAGAVPQSQSVGSFSMTGLFTGRTNQSASISGGREGQNVFLIDGVPNNSEKWGGVGITPSVDAIQEFKVLHTFFGAEYGQGNSIVNIAIKSGSNRFDGTVYEFLRDSALDARQWQDPGPDAPPFKSNQFGATLGGPLRRERTFFFLNYEGLRSSRSNTQRAIVPTPAMLAGDFSGVANIFDPATTAPDPTSPTGASRGQFPGNVIPADRISNTARVLAPFFPAPNVPGAAPGQINLIVNPTASSDNDQANVRIDHVLSDSDRLFGRYSYMDSLVTRPSFAPLFGLEFPMEGHNLAIQHTRVISSTLLNEFRFGFNRTLLSFSQEGANGTNFVEALGWSNLTDSSESFGLPAMILPGLSGFGPTTAAPIYSLNKTYQFVNNVVWTRGPHGFKFGTEISLNDVRQVTDLSSRGLLLFQGLSTTQYGTTGGGHPIADFLLGHPLAAQGATGLSPASFRSNFFNFYVQDDWKVHPRLTLNLGLRYEYDTPWSVEDNAFTYFDPSTNTLVSATPDTNQITLPEKDNFAPRIGLAYRPFGDNRTAIRAGWGVYHTRVEVNELEHGRNAPPFNYSQTIFGFPAGPVLLDADNLFPDPAVGVLRLSAHDRLGKRPYVQQFGLSIQRELWKNLLLDLSYVGALGRNLNLRRDLTQADLPTGPGDTRPLSERRPIPGFAGGVYATRDGTSDYHSGQFKLEKRFSDGLSFIAAYTLSKAIDQLSTVGGNNGQGIMSFRERPDLERGLAAFDNRHRFVFSYTYELPIGRDRPFLTEGGGIVEGILGGWNINGILTLASGFPLTILQNSDPSNTGLFPPTRPDRLADGNLPADERRPERWFDTTAFAPQAGGTIGSSGRNVIEGPGTQLVDFSLFKNVRLPKRATLQFRVEIFNLLNHPHFQSPGRGSWQSYVRTDSLSW